MIVINKQPIIRVVCSNPIGVVKWQPFTFDATEDQTVFVLPSTPVPNGSFILAINGVPQNKARGDFWFEANILHLNAGVDSGDKVYGMYEILPSIPVTSYTVVPFSFTAIEGQTTFTLASGVRLNGLIVADINGLIQNQAGGDFTIGGGASRNLLIFNAGLNAGDVVGGSYEQA